MDELERLRTLSAYHHERHEFCERMKRLASSNMSAQGWVEMSGFHLRAHELLERVIPRLAGPEPEVRFTVCPAPDK